MKTIDLLCLLAAVFLLCSCREKREKDVPVGMKGIVLGVQDMETVDWPRLAAENGINTIGTHMFPEQVLSFMQSEKGKAFLEGCRRYGIEVEHQLHAMHDLLPRDLFASDSMMFRMNESGRRTPDFNCCVSSQKALDIVAERAVHYARLLPPTNHRYYFWLDDGAPTCMCPECASYSSSEQALIVENHIIKALRRIDPQAQLAHLAYGKTLNAPRKVKPAEGIFLEFAPIARSWEKPLSDLTAQGRGVSHVENWRYLCENLEVFPAETAVVLEYWLDVSLFSNWTKPAVQLPWRKDVCKADIQTYGQLGIRNVTSFGVYMDEEYFTNYPDQTFLKEYAECFDGLEDAEKGEPVADEAIYAAKYIPNDSVRIDGEKREGAWREIYPVTRFINPWNDEPVEPTTLGLLCDEEFLYFYFDVIDTTPVSHPKMKDEMDVAGGDRVELFFSGTADLSSYIGLEIDPHGHVLDYKSKHYRQFDYDWQAKGLQVKTQRTADGYAVECAIPFSLLRDYFDKDNLLYWGAFRADFRKDGDKLIENWLCLRNPGTSEPDFHVPEAMSRLVVCKRE